MRGGAEPLIAFLAALLLGLSLGIFYDLLRPLRRRFPRLLPLCDGLYALGAGLLSFLFLLRSAGGEIRGFLTVGILGALLLHFLALGPFFLPLWDFWADTLGDLWGFALLPMGFLRRIWVKIAKRTKILFYFVRKCDTIKNTKDGGTFCQRREQPWPRGTGRRPSVKRPRQKSRQG